MTRPALPRLLSFALALATAFAGPGTALVHALQHERPGSAAHHVTSTTAHDHHQDHEPDVSGRTGSADDHPHPRLDAGPARTTVELSPLLAPAVEPALALQVTRFAPEINVAPLLPVVTATGPPPPSRSPPAI